MEAVHSRLTLPLLTPRLRLREFRESDFAAEVARLEALYADPRVTATLPFWPRTHEATVNRVKQVLRAQRARRRRLWELAVETRRGDFIGACGLVVVTPEAAVQRGTPRTAELGYVLGARRGASTLVALFGGRGVMRRSRYAIVHSRIKKADGRDIAGCRRVMCP